MKARSSLVSLVGMLLLAGVGWFQAQTPPTPATTPAEPPRLISVSISPEARVKATGDAAPRQLVQGEWRDYRVFIENAAGITAPMVIESAQRMTADTDTARDRWLKFELIPAGQLSGKLEETRILRIWSRDSGVRTAVLNFNAGQGTQDLGFRSDVLLTFIIAPKPRPTDPPQTGR